MKRIIPYAFVGMLSISLPTMLHAGNIPQYKVGYENADEFVLLENPTLVHSVFQQHTLIFPDGNEYCAEAHKGEGFPIGFTFRLGGQEFTQFAIDNLGAIYLGTDEDGITFRGQNTMMFAQNLPRDLDKADEFYLGMLTSGVWQEFKSADKGLGKLKPQIGYSLLGEEGDRVLVVEYRNMAPEKEKQSKAAHYDLQIRLYEADNHFELAFNEVVSPTSNYEFLTGARGFELEDAILLYAPTLGKAPTVSTRKYGAWDDMGCRVRWNGKDDYDQEYKPVYSFYPETDTTAPENMPKDLKVTQEGSSALISLRKAENSPATVVLYSETPLTDADYPEDGVTFRSQGKFGDYVTTIGNATVLYYGDRDEIDLELPVIENSKDYYFAALSVNGYPAFNRINMATAVLSTAQPAPTSLTAAVADKDKVKLQWEASDPVIIAVTDECSLLQNKGYQGVFGRPEADVKVGDLIPGGGKVIYVGDGSEFEWTELPSNGMNYFGVWTVRDGRVSALFTPAHACAPATIPYEARLEAYPSYVVPEIFDTKCRDEEDLGVYSRAGDAARALRIRLLTGVPIEFYLPEIDLSSGDTELSFEFAMETDRGVGMGDGGVELPLGYEPGVFGSGALEVEVREGDAVRVIEAIKEYPGSMTSNGNDGFVTGSSTFEPVKIDLSSVKQKARVGFKAEATTFSFLYLKNVKITRKGESGVEETISATPMAVSGGKGVIAVTAAEGTALNIYSIDGRLAATAVAEAGETVMIPVAPGLYIVNGVKVIVK